MNSIALLIFLLLGPVIDGDLEGLLAQAGQSVGALANRRPILLTATDENSLRKIMKAHPFSRFPLVEDGVVKGILEREEIDAALNAKHPPQLQPASVIKPETSLNYVQHALFNRPPACCCCVAWARTAALGW
jgi:hypothetical protein